MMSRYFNAKLFGTKRRGPGANWRQRGDTLRNAQKWGEAAEAYGRYLDRNPDDPAIWIQYGHMLKEAGQLEKAIAAYNRSEELDPGDAERDIHLFHLRERLAGVVVASKLSSVRTEEAPGPDLATRPIFRPTSYTMPGIGSTDIMLIADRLRRTR